MQDSARKLSSWWPTCSSRDLSSQLQCCSASRMGPDGPNREVRDFSWDEHVRYLTDAEFKLRYRVSWHSFGKLLKILEPGLRVANDAQAIKSRFGKPIELSLRGWLWLSGTLLEVVLWICPSSTGSAGPKSLDFACIWCAVDAINTHLKNIRFLIDDADAGWQSWSLAFVLPHMQLTRELD